MLFHVGANPVRVLEELHVAHLVDLVKADGLRRKDRADLLQVLLTRRHDRQAGTRERDLRRGRKIEDVVLRAVFLRARKDVRQMHILIVQLVYGVCVVPEDPEIRCRGLHCCKQLHRFVRIRVAVRVRELRHTPDALHRRIRASQIVYRIHVRTVRRHLYRHHFNAQRPADREVTVVSGRRADELDPSLSAPRLVTACHTKEHTAQDRVVHRGQRGVAQNEKL